MPRLKNTVSIFKLLAQVYNAFTQSRRRKFWGVLGLALLVSAFEVITLGAIFPFLLALSEPGKLYEYEIIGSVLIFLDLRSPEDLLFPLTLAFIVIAMVSSLIRVFYIWFSYRVSFNGGIELGNNVYQNILYRPYSYHVEKNSSELINAIYFKSALVITGAVMPVITMISSFFIMIAIIGSLVVLSPVVSIIMFGCLGTIYVVISMIFRRMLLKNGKIIASQSTAVLKALQEGVGGIRDVLLNGKQEVYCSYFDRAMKKLRKAQADNEIFAQTPRFILEGVGLVVISLFAYFLLRRADGFADNFAMLGAFALGGQRLMPSLQAVYASWTKIQGSSHLLGEILDFTKDFELDNRPPVSRDWVKFEKAIELRGVGFRYKSSHRMVIIDLTLKIYKGETIGILGASGCGKSTIIDLVMGLLSPTSGEVLIDSVPLGGNNTGAWQKQIAHVSQTIYLTDSSIAENIGFGLESDEIDYERVYWAAKAACLYDEIIEMDAGFNTFVGERGVRLSGGQCQRLGIARALYKDAAVLVMDEATSALDSLTEKKVISSVIDVKESQTIIMISHRPSTLAKCSSVYRVHNGNVEVVQELGG